MPSWLFPHVTKQTFLRGNELFQMSSIHQKSCIFTVCQGTVPSVDNLRSLWMWRKHPLQCHSAAPGSEEDTELADQTTWPCQAVSLFIPRTIICTSTAQCHWQGDPEEGETVRSYQSEKKWSNIDSHDLLLSFFLRVLPKGVNQWQCFLLCLLSLSYRSH